MIDCTGKTLYEFLFSCTGQDNLGLYLKGGMEWAKKIGEGVHMPQLVIQDYELGGLGLNSPWGHCIPVMAKTLLNVIFI